MTSTTLQSAIRAIALLTPDGSKACLEGLRDRALVVTAVTARATPEALSRLTAGSLVFGEHGATIDLPGPGGAAIGGTLTLRRGAPLLPVETLEAWDTALQSTSSPLFPALDPDWRPTELAMSPKAIRAVLNDRLGAPMAAASLPSAGGDSLVRRIAAERAAWRRDEPRRASAS